MALLALAVLDDVATGVEPKSTLAFVALDDVTTGVEPKSPEWLMAAFAVVRLSGSQRQLRGNRRRVRCAGTTTGSGS